MSAPGGVSSRFQTTVAGRGGAADVGSVSSLSAERSVFRVARRPTEVVATRACCAARLGRRETLPSCRFVLAEPSASLAPSVSGRSCRRRTATSNGNKSRAAKSRDIASGDGKRRSRRLVKTSAPDFSTRPPVISAARRRSAVFGARAANSGEYATDSPVLATRVLPSGVFCVTDAT